MKPHWTHTRQPVPGHPGWVFFIGVGARAYWVGHTGRYHYALIYHDGAVESCHVPAPVVRWLLDNHPPLDSWLPPGES